ncbi:hypothetical protein J4Q44_G00209980 [Coregonus suidteri]|uniref:Uncharacterized protein n=1 Tax=Coregonus suidteri TaxID=861788 RepID=A0AAN8L8Y4_9TELE
MRVLHPRMQRGGSERHLRGSGGRGGAQDSGLKRRSSHSDHHAPSKITQNARESKGVLGQGLKQLFQQQRRRLSLSRSTLASSSSSSASSSSSSSAISVGSPSRYPPEDYLTPLLAPFACPDSDPPSGGLLAPPAGQSAGPVGTMRRGTILQSRHRGGNGTGAGAGGGDRDPPLRGSPQASHRHSTYDAQKHSDRLRSSSTTDNTMPSSPSPGYHPGYAKSGDVVLLSGYQSMEETDKVFYIIQQACS